MTTFVGVKAELDAICVMDGNSSLIIRCSIRPTSVKIRIAERVHVLIITLKNKEELLILHSLISVSSSFLKTEL